MESRVLLKTALYFNSSSRQEQQQKKGRKRRGRLDGCTPSACLAYRGNSFCLRPATDSGNATKEPRLVVMASEKVWELVLKFREIFPAIKIGDEYLNCNIKDRLIFVIY
jgi:hypothetical protein